MIYPLGGKRRLHHRSSSVFFGISVFIFLGAFLSVIATSEADTARVLAFTKNMIRQDASSSFKDGGKMYCGPVTAANALVAVHELGDYSFSIPRSTPSQMRMQLAELLASSEYMRTADKGGTWAAPFMEGILRYLYSQGFKNSEIELLGFSPLPDRLEQLRKSPRITPNTLTALIKIPKDLVWLHVGWYEWDSTSNTYVHAGAHYLHLVGMDGAQFLATNSSPSRRSIPVEKFSLIPLRSGKIVDERAKLSLSTEGQFSLLASPPLRGEKTAVVQGVVHLKIRK